MSYVQRYTVSSPMAICYLKSWLLGSNELKSYLIKSWKEFLVDGQQQANCEADETMGIKESMFVFCAQLNF